MVVIARLFQRTERKPMAHLFRRSRCCSAGYMAFAHGSNDAQKTMGIVTLALFSAGVIPTVDVPWWVIVDGGHGASRWARPSVAGGS